MKSISKTLIACLLCLACCYASAEPLDINTAAATEIAERVSGIGPQRAQAIVEFREKNGPFSSIDDLVLVKGIGLATIEKNRESLRANTQ